MAVVSGTGVVGPLRVLIVDDEPPARRGIRQLLAPHPDFQVVGECRDGREALKALAELQPDLVFLDVQMPELDGFGVLRIHGAERMPPVVFVTAYDEFAVRAFEAQALDYLVKPLERARFDRTLARVRERRELAGARDLAARLGALLTRGGTAKSWPARLAVPRSGGTLLVPVGAIDWIEADDYFARIHTGGRSHLLRESLVSLAGRLDPACFLRIHRSAIVRIDRILALRADASGELLVVLTNGTEVPVSRRQRARVRALLTTRSAIDTAR